MLNKEEIENAKQCLNEIIQNTYAEGKAKKLDTLRKYINELEQKESILDKVTDKLKEDIKKYNKELMKDSIMSIKNTDLTGRILQSQKILNIIEGEKK